MGWKNMPYWFRGIVIGVVLSIIGATIIFFIDDLICPLTTSSYPSCILPPSFWYFAFSSMLIGGPLLNMITDALNLSLSVYLTILFSSLINFVIIGLIIGKIKSKSNKK